MNRRRPTLRLWLALALGPTGCITDTAPDAAFDAAFDAATDAATDAPPPRPDAARCPDDRFGFGTRDVPAAALPLGRQADLVVCGDADHFALDAPLGIAVAATVEAERPVVLTFSAPGLDDVVGTGRNPLIRQRNPAGGLHITIEAEVPGPPIHYALSLGLAPTTCAKAAEPDSAEAPRTLQGSAEGVVCAGDEDWLHLDGPAGASAELRVTALGGEGVRLEAVQQVDGFEVPTAAVETATEATLGVLLPADGLRLRLRPISGGGGWRVAAVVADEPGLEGQARGQITAFNRAVTADGLGDPTPRPAPGIHVEVLHDATARLAGLATTDATGAFAVDFAAPSLPVRLRIRAEAAEVGVGPPGAGVWAEDLVRLEAAGTALPNPLAPEPLGPTAAALHVALVLTEGMARARPYLSDTLAFLRVDWAPNRRPTCGSCFHPESGHIDLSGVAGDDDQWDDAVILHELGHHLAAVHGRDDSPGGRHDGRRTWPPLAWSEGFASFFAAWQLGSPILVDRRPTGPLVTHLETLEDPRALGTEDGTLEGDVSELLVAAVLWDLLDGGPDDDDPVVLPEAVLLPALFGGLAAYSGEAGVVGLDLADALDLLAVLAPEADLAAVAALHGYPWP